MSISVTEAQPGYKREKSNQNVLETQVLVHLAFTTQLTGGR